MTPEPTLNGHFAAFFDLDGTLLPGPSLERRFFSELRRNNKIPLVNYLRWSVEALRLLPKGILAVQHNNKRYLTGLSCDLVFRYMESICFFEEGIARIVWHARQNHKIVLISGTLQPLAELAASALECELELRGIHIHTQICATRLAEVRGQWTGHLAAEAVQGPAKARAVEEFAKQYQIDLPRSYAYGNNLLDRHFLSAVGHANAVNPGRELAALANKRDWPIWHWHLEKQIAAQQPADLVEEIHHIEERA
jgi:putative phosphoserine phosphatase / 1-acylglycerol-3-phosphate O-acyltransferase